MLHPKRPLPPISAPPLRALATDHWRILRWRRSILGAAALVALSACTDADLRGDFSGAFDTSDAVRVVAAPRPQPDDRGVISYTGYQVAVARRGDSIDDVADRVGVSREELARFNGIPDGAVLRDGEIVALPNRVAEPSPATGARTEGTIRPAGQIDIATLAGPAIDRGAAGQTGQRATPTASDAEPVRHKVARGETAFSISRRYGVPLRALAEWNGLDSDYAVREGQFLLIPVTRTTPAPTATPAPGTGTRAPEPPSAAQPLPDAAPQQAAETPPSPRLEQFASPSASGGARMVRPVEGRILRDFRKGRNDGIDIAAPAGTPVRAAQAGTVAAVTRDTDGIPILVLRHEDGILTVYAGLDDLQVGRGDTVSRGQRVASVRAGDPSFVHFEVRNGLEAVDPTPFLTP